MKGSPNSTFCNLPFLLHSSDYYPAFCNLVTAQKQSDWTERTSAIGGTARSGGGGRYRPLPASSYSTGPSLSIHVLLLSDGPSVICPHRLRPRIPRRSCRTPHTLPSSTDPSSYSRTTRCPVIVLVYDGLVLLMYDGQPYVVLSSSRTMASHTPSRPRTHVQRARPPRVLRLAARRPVSHPRICVRGARPCTRVRRDGRTPFLYSSYAVPGPSSSRGSIGSQAPRPQRFDPLSLTEKRRASLLYG